MSTLAKAMAMPPPMVPEPMMPQRFTSRGLSAGVMPGTSATARSAKNRWRMAFDSGVPSEPSLMARSSASPCSNGSSHEPRTAAMSSSGVIMPRCCFAACARNAAICASESGATLLSRTRRGPLPSAINRFA